MTTRAKSDWHNPTRFLFSRNRLSVFSDQAALSCLISLATTTTFYWINCLCHVACCHTNLEGKGGSKRKNYVSNYSFLCTFSLDISLNVSFSQAEGRRKWDSCFRVTTTTSTIMLSMCGLLCSVLRGWRHNQAVMLMARALSQTNASLLVQDLSSGPVSGSGQGRSGFSPFCVVEGEKGLSQLLWCDNNKQAVMVSPRVSVL